MCWGKTKVRFLITMEGPKAVNNGLWTARCDSGIVFSAEQELFVALFCRGFRISTFRATSFEILKELYLFLLSVKTGGYILIPLI